MLVAVIEPHRLLARTGSMETIVTLLVIILSAALIGMLAKSLRDAETRQSIVARLTKEPRARQT